MALQDNTQFEFVLVVRVDDLADLPGWMREAIKQIKKISEDDVADEVTGNGGSCSGNFAFSIRDRFVIDDEARKLPGNFLLSNLVKRM